MRVLLLFSCLVFYFILFLDLLAKVSDTSILNRVYNTLHNQSTTIKGFNLYSYGLRLQKTDTRHTKPMWNKHS